MRLVTGDYSVSVYEGTEQYRSPQLLVPHPEYDKSTNNADIMLIKVRALLHNVIFNLDENTLLCPGLLFWV